MPFNLLRISLADTIEKQIIQNLKESAISEEITIVEQYDDLSFKDKAY